MIRECQWTSNLLQTRLPYVWWFIRLTMPRCGIFSSKLVNWLFSEDTVVCRDNRQPTELKNLKLSGLKGLWNFQKPLLYQGDGSFRQSYEWIVWNLVWDGFCQTLSCNAWKSWAIQYSLGSLRFHAVMSLKIKLNKWKYTLVIFVKVSRPNF